MSRFRRFEIVDPYFPSFFLRDASVFAPKALGFFPSFVADDEEVGDLSFALDLLDPCRRSFEVYDTVTDLIQVEKAPSVCSYRRIQQRVGADFCLQKLCDRVSALESRFDRMLASKIHDGDRKYTWTAEIKGPEERRYKWSAEIMEGKKKEETKKKAGLEKKYKWTAEIKGKGDTTRKYIFETSSGDAGECSGSEKKEKKEKQEKKKKKKKVEAATRLVEIEEAGDHGTLVLRQAFARRGRKNSKGKQKELSPQDAALLIQMTFRAYLIRRSQALRALRELAIAKSKLKEIRALFNNFSYRRHIARDGEERQKFSEKIIVLLLTVDAIEGADLMVRAAKRSMVDELEAMLDVVDPQPPGKLLSMKRRTFDMPDGVIQKEIAEGVAQVVRMINDDESDEA